MTEPLWPAPGVDCICINPNGWPDIYETPFGIINLGPRDGPVFMQQYKISETYFAADDDPGHRLKLIFAEFGDYVHCTCQFRPLEKIEDDVKQTTTAPVDVLV